MVRKKDRFFRSVAAASTVTSTYTPTSEELLIVSEAYGQAGMSPDTVVSVVWDEGGGEERVLFCTHGSGSDPYVNFKVQGDGVKKITLKLTNNQLTADILGVGWRD